ncbi:MAG TPA: hypothetical protein VJU15_15425 [Gemmatimonadales bacterium]|nr:hypothetical protein [Gemmatimonadales bacterium]
MRDCSSSPLVAGFLPPTDTGAMILALVLIAAVALAAVAYHGLERLGRRALLPASLRAIAWASLGVLLLNPGCPLPPEQSRPIVLLDGSLSMRAAGARFDAALADARGAGEVRLFGDPETRLDSVPVAGRSLLAPALAAARASGRPVIVVTDGELADSLESLPLLTGVGVRLFERKAGPAVAIASVRGPARITERDTLRLSADIHASGMAGRVASAITVRSGEKVLGSAPVAIGDGLSTVEIAIPGRALGAGEHALTIALRDSLDTERRDDRRLQLVTVSPTPGVVLVASPGDWESRFLYRVLRDVTDLPVEGFVELVRGQWKRMSNLQPVDGAEVRQAVSRADLAILRGATDLAQSVRGASLEWPIPAGADDSGGDWYLAAADGPPAGALAGAPVDSFAPMTALLPLSAEGTAWTGLTAQAGRRGTLRPALIGSVKNGARHVVIGAQGLWRWAFRGGSSEQAYRSLFAGTVDWLLAGQDTIRGRARPVRTVVPNGRPIAFSWIGGGVTEPVAIRLRGSDGSTLNDTLTFDGSGHAGLRLPVGTYTYQLSGGGRGIVAVEEYSDEWFPRPVVVETAVEAPFPSDRRQGIRERWWLFAIGIIALCGEWVVRRRMGLR